MNFDKLLKSGLALANISFGKMINHPTRVEIVNQGILSESTSFKLQDENDLLILNVKFTGDFGGEGWFHISDQNCQKIFESTFPGNIGQDVEAMKIGFLTEIANIMMSSMITELADELEMEVFNNIPDVYRSGKKDPSELLKEQAMSSNKEMHFVSAIFCLEQKNPTFELFWIFDEGCVERLSGKTVSQHV